MSDHPLNRALREHARQKCQRPEGSYTAEEASAQWGKTSPCSVEKAKSLLGEMVRSGIMVEVRGSRLTLAGQIVPCTYYRPAKAKS